MWLGIDIGTHAVRAVALDEAGRAVASASTALRSIRSGGRHEQDPAGWQSAAAAACRQVMGQLRGAGELRGVAVDSTSGTLALVDRRGRPAGPALMYDDNRAEPQAEELRRTGCAAWERLGHRPQSSWSLAKMLWLQEQGAVEEGRAFAHQADLVAAMLTGGRVATDSSHALKSGYDPLERRWPKELVENFRLEASSLPAVVEPGTVLGRVTASAAVMSGIPAGTAVFAGMTDGCAAQIGSGALGRGDCNAVLGTTLVLKASSASLVTDPSGALYSHRNPDGGWLPGGASNTGGRCLEVAFPGVDLARMDTAAARHEPASVIAYPLVGRGERFPFLAPQAEGFLTGTPADEADHYAALLQGVAFVERLGIEHLGRLGVATNGRLTFSGGGAKSPYWCQLRSDVLGRPAAVPATAEPAAGMAILAAWASGAYPSLGEAASHLVRYSAHIEPREDSRSRWDGPYEAFLAAIARRGWLDGPHPQA